MVPLAIAFVAVVISLMLPPRGLAISMGSALAMVVLGGWLFSGNLGIDLD